MNVIFISPNFPEHFYLFCDRLKRLGVSVLGIGDCPFEQLDRRVVDALTDYRWLPSLENYDSVYRTVASYIAKYGRVDYVESQNEYWLELEARLRDDFNVSNGFRVAELTNFKFKSKMKSFYASAGIKTTRFYLVDPKNFAGLKEFVSQVGYPIVIKPDSGVGASDTRKITSEEELASFWDDKREVSYIAEEFVPGHVETFDGITNAKGEILFATGQVMAVSPLEMIKGAGENVSYTTDVIATGLFPIGERVVKAFGVRSRFFHFEFFRLDANHPTLGRKGDLFGLEVNMRAPGGYIPDKMNYAYDVDVYQIWAESLVYNDNRSFPDYAFKYYVAHVGRGAKIQYAHSVDEIRERFHNRLLYDKEPPKSINATMGSHIFLLRSESLDELNAQSEYILRRSDGTSWRL